MTVAHQIADRGDLLHRLRAVDVRRRVFGSTTDEYRLGAVLTEVE